MSRLNKISVTTLFLTACFYCLSFYFLDQPIAQLFHTKTFSNSLNDFFHLITLLGDSKFAVGFVVLSFIVAITILFKYPQNKFANSLLFLGLAMTMAIFLETSLKYLLGRYRPELFFQQGLYGFHYLSHEYLMNSTPSGHATRAFVLLTGCCLTWKKWTPVFILIGLAVCLSRLVLECHYLSDVVFGAVLGTLVTLWIAKIYYAMTISNHTVAVFKSR